jgi:hypothetical protein
MLKIFFTNKRNIIEGRRLKWYNVTANYSFEVDFIKGTNNFIADYLSINHHEELLNKQLIEINILQESMNPPKQGEWITIAKKAPKAPIYIYIYIYIYIGRERERERERDMQYEVREATFNT